MGDAQDGTEHVGHEQMLRPSVLLINVSGKFAARRFKISN